MTNTTTPPPDPPTPSAPTPTTARPVTELSAWPRWGNPAAAMAAVANRRRQEQHALQSLGRSAGDDPVVRLVLAAGRWSTWVQHDVGLLRSEIQTLRAYIGDRWQNMATDVDHIRRLDLVLDTAVENLDATVAAHRGPNAEAMTSAWQRCLSTLRELPTQQIEEVAAAPGDVPQFATFERWRGQKSILTSYDKYVSCAPDVHGRLGIVAGRLGAPVIHALHEVSSLRVGAAQAHANADPVAEMRRHGDNVMSWNAEQITAFEHADLSIDQTPPPPTSPTTDPIARMERLARNPPQNSLPGLSL